MKPLSLKKLIFLNILLLVIGIANMFYFQTKKAEAAIAFGKAGILLERMKIGVTASSSNRILVYFQPASTSTEARVTVTFPVNTNEYALSADASITASTTSITGVSVQNGTLTAAVGLGTSATSVTTASNISTVLFPIGDLTPGILYGFYITGGVVNPATAATYQHTITTQTSAPADIDTTPVATDVVSDDQVTVSATVAQTFNFALSGTTIAFVPSPLTSSTVSVGAITIDIDTNANNGYIAYVKDANNGTLNSAITGETIDATGTINSAAQSMAAGTEGYGLDVNGTDGSPENGTLTIAGEYNGTDTASPTVGTLSSTYQQIAYRDGGVQNDTLTLSLKAAISSLTESATDYADTLTVIGSGNF